MSITGSFFRPKKSFKIFGIGLSRTGTYSLTDALNILGIKAVHWDHTRTAISCKDDRLCINFRKFDSGYQAFTDTPVARFYKELDRKYPGSKFIFTVRDINSWLGSCKRHFTAKQAMTEGEHVHKLRVEIYGRPDFEEDAFRKAYYDHQDRVLTYFKDRPNDLLVIDICAGEGWSRLCPFLGKPIPEVVFPVSNTGGQKTGM